jgi:hypothetical protein
MELSAEQKYAIMSVYPNRTIDESGLSSRCGLCDRGGGASLAYRCDERG